MSDDFNSDKTSEILNDGCDSCDERQENQLCCVCQAEPVLNQKRQLCRSCYGLHEDRGKRYARTHLCKPIGLMMLNRVQSRANQRGMECNLDLKWFTTRLALGRCEVTKIPLEMPQVGVVTAKRKRSPWLATVDRIDSNLGYTKENSRLVALIYNLAKAEWSDQEVLRMILFYCGLPPKED